MTRCFNKKCNCYHLYGGRGITVCEFIKQSYKALIGLIGERPNGTMINRIDNNGNYSCGSCDECKKWGWPLNIEWASLVDQSRNKRNNNLVTIDGITRCVTEWEQIHGLRKGIINQRLKRGWSGSKLLGSPIDWSKYVTICGETKNLCEWAEQLGISDVAFGKRIKKGWKDSELLLKRQRPKQVSKLYAHNRIRNS